MGREGDATIVTRTPCSTSRTQDSKGAEVRAHKEEGTARERPRGTPMSCDNESEAAGRAERRCQHLVQVGRSTLPVRKVAAAALKACAPHEHLSSIDDAAALCASDLHGPEGTKGTT